jgi:hypothetical protein
MSSDRNEWIGMQQGDILNRFVSGVSNPNVVQENESLSRRNVVIQRPLASDGIRTLHKPEKHKHDRPHHIRTVLQRTGGFQKKWAIQKLRQLRGGQEIEGVL